jgi:hypothetical protein
VPIERQRIISNLCLKAGKVRRYIESQIMTSKIMRILQIGIFPLCACLYLIARCTIVGNEPFWFDEILTVYFIRDPSLPHMIEANRDAINTFPPFYFVVLRIWSSFFGPSEFSLRLFSTICFCGSVFVLWKMSYQRYGMMPSIFAITAAVVTNPVMLPQIAQARPYGFLFLLCSVAAYYGLTLYTKSNPRLIDYFLQTLIHLCFILTHPIAILSSGMILLAALSSDAINRSITKKTLYFVISVLLSWILFALLWGKDALNQSSAFSPYSWIPYPAAYRVIEYFTWYSGKTGLLMILSSTCLLGVLWVFFRQKRDNSILPVSGSTYLLCLGFLLAFVPGAILILLSLIGQPIFMERYVITSGVGWVILLASGFSTALRTVPAKSQNTSTYKLFLNSGIFTIITLFIIFWAYRHLFAKEMLIVPEKNLPPNFEKYASADKYKDLPIVWTDAHNFAVAHYYSSEKSRHFFIRDKEFVIRSGINIGVNWSHFINLGALQRHYPMANAVEWDAFSEQHPRFLVYEQPLKPYSEATWADFRLRSDKRYQVKELYRSGKNRLSVVELQ